MKKEKSNKEQKESVADMEKALYQLGFEESYKIDEKDVIIYVLKNHLYDLGFEDIYVSQLISKFKEGFQEGNEHTKELFVKKYLLS
jgi:hypothetical protein